MKYKFNIRREVKIAAVLIVVLCMIAFTERIKEEVAVRIMKIKMENISENHFLDEEDITRLMKMDQTSLVGMSLEKLNFKEIEEKIRINPFVHDAELYSDFRGNITVNVRLRRPVARIVRNDGPDGYIAE